MTTAILAIHPRHVAAILAGHKTVEIRRVVPARNVTRLVIYETAPASRVVAECDVHATVGEPDAIWRTHRSWMAVTRREFDAYLRGRDRACALLLGPIREPRSHLLADYGQRRPPQSWAYVPEGRSS